MSAYLDLIMFIALMMCILSGFPVSFSIAGVAVAFAYLGWLLDVMSITRLGTLGQRFFGIMTNDVLIAIPLFVLMGIVLERSKIAEELLNTMGRLFGRMYGGLGISVVLVGALLAASTGIVGATVIAMGMIALPAMLRAGYSPTLASGLVCTSGTLGQIIPPSTLLIILSDVMSSAFQQAQYEAGKFTVETISVGQLFAGALIPGLTLVLLYIIYLLVRGLFRPQDMPPLHGDGMSFPTLKEVLHAVVPPLALIVAVLGAILGGVASPTEAAAVGATGAILLAGFRYSPHKRWILVAIMALLLLIILSGLYPVRLQRSDITAMQQFAGYGYIGLTILGFVGVLLSLVCLYKRGMLSTAMTSAMSVTAMIFATILTASCFSLVFVSLGGDEHINDILTAMPGGANGALLFSMLLIFILGFFLDFVEITVILLPLIAPVLMVMGHDPIWLAILIAINLQTSFLTPPFGFSLFYLRGAAPKSISTGQIYAGVVPFIGIQILAMALIWALPALATWLPNLLF